ncbi:nuclear transport factor 2 family protein [Luteimonas aestuarii]|uniref:Nuclear transport factor 2 family protein n=1 Tax=Luteimonas aestuarii TaxID=453837 RepID=A0A4R5TQ79_9GAMM|nr:nuclear transport factor 2 family protein [Luteimonas aestuarii]
MLLLAGTACARSDPEERLRERAAELHAAIESREVAAMQHLLADDFVGNDGLDGRQARALASMLMSRYRSIGVTFGPMDVQLQPPANATVRFHALTTGGDEGLLPQRVQAYDVETAWREDSGEWVLYHAKWTPRL